MPKKETSGVQIPADLSTLSPEELSTLEKSALSEFDTLTNDPELTAEGLAAATALGESIENIRVESAARVAAAEELAAGREALKSRVHGAKDEDDEEKAAAKIGDDEDKNEHAEAVTASGRKVPVEDVLKSGNKLNIKLSDAQKHQPVQTPSLRDDFDASVLVASADIPGFSQGGQIANMADLVKAYTQRSRNLPVGSANRTGAPISDWYRDGRSGELKFGEVAREGDWRNANRIPIAQMQRQFRHMLDVASSPQDAWEVMQEAANPSSLVAAGGWCSPSEIRYDFYNIVAMDGAVDLPTAGINRGGVRFPTSPSFGDLASSTGLWHWNETQDIAAATGTAQSGSKTCARVPCAAMNEVRLEGEGICITAGNLTTDAWPEQLSNFLRLVNAAHFHRVNSFFINALIAQSTAVTVTPVANTGASTNILAALELQAWDLRTKYAMSDSDVLEVIMPSWMVGTVRADISRRNGLGDNPAAILSITNAEIASWFTMRNISVQFVQDFDVRTTGYGQSTPATTWPTLNRFIMYPAGTWLRGNGLNLDLGVIRDSTLNATNDYTAAWSEEFFLLAKIGHESRVVTVANIFPNGASGLQVQQSGI